MSSASSNHVFTFRAASINTQSTTGFEDALESQSPIRGQPPLSRMSVLQSDHQLVAKIDQLYKCGVDKQIDLPQLVVVGNQSSGKSSVLSALTRLPFPQGSETCTRFPTKVILRYAANPRVSISIRGTTRTSDGRYDTFKKNWAGRRRESFDTEEFQRVLRDAHRTMQLKDRPDDTRADLNAFSRDVLEIEIDGPTEQHFSVIDLPGIFHSAEDQRTDEADIYTVRNIAKAHIKSSRSLVLAVVSATEEPANQAVLEMAKKCGKLATGTLGVLTKPDLTPDNMKEIVAGMLKGDRHKLGLGWNVVLNKIRCNTQAEFDRRDSEEVSFFAGGEFWQSLDSERQGITKLRERLRALLLERVKASLPGVEAEIRDKLKKEKKRLSDLGARKTTPAEQRTYLNSLSQDFQRVVSQTLEARYHTDGVFKATKGLNLATMIDKRNERFASDLENFGHSYEFLQFGEDEEEDEEQDEEEDREEEEEEEEEVDNDEDSRGGSEDESAGVDNRNQTSDTGSASIEACEEGSTRRFIDAQYSGNIRNKDIIDRQTRVETHPADNIESWLQKIARDAQGFRLDAFSSDLLPRAMEEQSRKWEPLAYGYISDIIQMVQSFIEKLLGSICPDETIRRRLLQRILGHSLGAYKEARKHVQFLLDNERARIPITYNRAYYTELQQITQQRAQDQLDDQAVPRQRDGRRIRAIPVGSVASHRTDSIQHNAEKLHDSLCAYYNVALPRFVDNVCIHAASFHLHGTSSLEKDKTPLRFFSPAWVARLTDEELKAIAGEDEAVENSRRELEGRIKDLEEGIEILGQP